VGLIEKPKTAEDGGCGWWSLGSGLRAWKDGMTYIDVDRLLLLDQHALLILRQMLLQDFRIMSRHCHF